PPYKQCLLKKNKRQQQGKQDYGIEYLRPCIVLYNKGSPDAEAIRAIFIKDLRLRPDAIIIAGTLLEIIRVRRIVREIYRVVSDHRNSIIIWINIEPKPVSSKLKSY
ncbi:uncharacterized protein BDZ99DRAFT_388014, partial [Mytilinidion resinicola]